MPSYEALRNKQNELIRKAVDGSVFIAPITAPLIETLTVTTGSVIDLAELPEGYDDLGWLTGDGAQFARNVSTSDITSWGSVTPTRSDITADTSTLQVTAQETKLLTIGLATGAELSSLVPNPTTGELVITKSSRPKSKAYRALSLAVDEGDAGEIYIGRFLPRAKVTGFSEQSFGAGDSAIGWGVTLTAEGDSGMGNSTERWFFGGPGWKAILADMGFKAA